MLAQALARAGVRHLFSLSGNQIMPVYDAAPEAGLSIMHVRHEGAAVHMADAWGRLTGEPGIALVTGGPGHANAVGALYTALAGESPLVLLSGHAPLAELGRGAFQEMAQADLAAPITKASWTARDPALLATDMARALAVARSGRPGPVHVSLPFDVLEAKVEKSPVAGAGVALPAARPLPDATASAVLAEMERAQRPLVLLGPAMANRRGRDACDKLAVATGVPVVCMESPRGVNDPCLGAFADVLREADLLVLSASSRISPCASARRRPLPQPAVSWCSIPSRPRCSARSRRLGRVASSAPRSPTSRPPPRRCSPARGRAGRAHGRARWKRQSVFARPNGARSLRLPADRCIRSRSAAPCSKFSTAHASPCWSPTAASSGNGRRRA